MTCRSTVLPIHCIHVTFYGTVDPGYHGHRKWLANPLSYRLIVYTWRFMTLWTLVILGIGNDLQIHCLTDSLYTCDFYGTVDPGYLGHRKWLANPLSYRLIVYTWHFMALWTLVILGIGNDLQIHCPTDSLYTRDVLWHCGPWLSQA